MDRLFSPLSGFDVFKETPAGALIEANRRRSFWFAAVV